MEKSNPGPIRCFMCTEIIHIATIALTLRDQFPDVTYSDTRECFLGRHVLRQAEILGRATIKENFLFWHFWPRRKYRNPGVMFYACYCAPSFWVHRDHKHLR